ncbi:MAG: Bug family tripartite tricarboxylate transporter substrate binding protein [Betaproteobacteria bacterium]
MSACRLLFVSVAVAALGTAGAGHAQNYPAKPVRVLIASSAGSNPDTVLRVISGELSKAWGQQIVVDNRAGAGGNIGAEIAARAPADGYNLFMAHTNHTINISLYRKLSYDLARDFVPISLVALSPFVATVHPSLPVKSLRELIRLAKARPGDLAYASAGTGSGTFFCAEYFNGMAGVKMLHVSYKGGGPALAAVIAGETSVYFTPIATGMPHVRSGKLRPLGVTAPKRLPNLPDLPAIAETLPGYEMLSWAGLMAPQKTPQAVIDFAHKTLAAALQAPELNKRLNDLGYIVVGGGADALAAHIRTETERYAKLIRQIGLPPQ